MLLRGAGRVLVPLADLFSADPSPPTPPTLPRTFCRPVAEGTGRVARFELVPLSELGRPRIDVLCNMSGIFRDSFQVGGS